MKWLKNYNGFKSINESNQIDSLCEEYGIKNYTINEDGTVDVDDSVIIKSSKSGRLPLRFGRVTGDFRCENIGLISLEGSPNYVGNNFHCRHNKIKNLIGGPQIVMGFYMASFNEIESLEGSPQHVEHEFFITNNKLKNLIGCPIGLKNYFFSHNQLESLEGSPKIVDGIFDFGFNKLKSLSGSPEKVVTSFNCSNNQLKSLVGGPKECGIYYANNNELTDLVGAAHSCVRFICSNNQLKTLKGDIRFVEELFSFSGNQVTIINFKDIEFFECSKFEAEDDFGIGSNPIHNIICLFEDFKDFKYSLEFNYLREPNIIDRLRFNDACQDAGIKMPDSIEGYIIE